MSKIDNSVFGGDHLWTTYWGDHPGRKGKLTIFPTIFTKTKPVDGIVILKDMQVDLKYLSFVRIRTIQFNVKIRLLCQKITFVGILPLH